MWAVHPPNRTDVVGGPSVLLAMAGDILQIVVARLARLLAVNTSPAGVRIWDMQKQPPTQLWVIPGEGDLVFSKDGSLLAIVSGGATILDVSSGQIMQKFAGGSFENSLFSVQFSPDGRILAGLGISNTLSWWDVQSGQLISQVTIDQCEKTFALQSSSDGTLVVGCGADKLLLWDMTTQSFQGEINLEPYLPRGNNTNQSIVVEKLIFSPDNHYLAVSGRYVYTGGYSNPYIQIWDFQNQTYLSSIMAYIQYADGFQSVNDKMTFVTIENPFDGTTITSNIVKLVYYDLQTGKILQEAPLPARMGTVKKIGGLAALPQFGEVILAGTKEGFSMWKLDSP